MDRPRSVTIASLALAVSLIGCTSAATPPATPGESGPAPSTSTSPGSCDTGPQPTDLTGWDVANQTPTSIPILLTQDIACGDNRFMFLFLDRASNRPVSAPDRPAGVAFYDIGDDAARPVERADSTFVWAIPDERGVYVADATFSQAGVWGAEFTFGGAGGSVDETVRLLFTVRPSPTTVAVGSAAPPSKTLTLADVGGDVAKISTDADPVPAFYSTSIDAAIAAHEPFVVVFATPKFCVSAQCGPTLDRIKPIARANPDVTFINVEPYVLEEQDGQLQPVMTEVNGQPNLTPVAAVDEWRLAVEPWVFVVDARGIIRGSFELIFSDAELQAAIEAATAPGQP